MKKKINRHVILAGTARAGKTTVCLELLQYGFIHYKMDSIKRGICEAFQIDQHNWAYLNDKMAYLVNTILKENKTDTVAGNEYYVIDTCHVLPENISLITEDALVIFLGYADISVEEKMKEMRTYDKQHYWSSHLTDEELKRMVQANITLSQFIREECKKYHLFYYDTSYNRDEVLKEVVRFITENSMK